VTSATKAANSRLSRSCDGPDDERRCGNKPADQASGDNQTDVTRGHDDFSR